MPLNMKLRMWWSTFSIHMRKSERRSTYTPKNCMNSRNIYTKNQWQWKSWSPHTWWYEWSILYGFFLHNKHSEVISSSLNNLSFSNQNALKAYQMTVIHHQQIKYMYIVIGSIICNITKVLCIYTVHCTGKLHNMFSSCHTFTEILITIRNQDKKWKDLHLEHCTRTHLQCTF